METVFPEHQGYEGTLFVGFRKRPVDPAVTQRVGTVILKRTYHIEGAGVLDPSVEVLPIFLQDISFNLVVNGDFESSQATFGESDDPSKPAVWQETGATATRIEDPLSDSNHILRVTGPASGRVIQTIDFDAPLGGRQFTLGFRVQADNDLAQISGARIEVDSGEAICVIDSSVDTSRSHLEETGTWPNGVSATEMRVVLPMASSAASLFYDDVQVEERDRVSTDSLYHLQFENDLAPFKPRADLVVLGFMDITGQSSLRVNGTTRLQRNVLASNTDPSLFGWQIRTENPRASQRGDLSTDPDDYPPEWPFSDPGRDPLPSDFQNRFFNGFSRAAALVGNLLDHLPAAATIQIDRPGAGNDYVFSLRDDTSQATLFHYSGSGLDIESCWERQAIAMNLDTLVIEPDIDRCYVVWRGVWDFDSIDPDTYRLLVVEGSV